MSADSSEQAAEGKNRMEVSQASDQHPSASETPEPDETEQMHPHPNMVEPLSDHRGNCEYKALSIQYEQTHHVL